MSSYLEAYGASEEYRARRIRLIKNSSIALACALVAGSLLYAFFRNYGEEQKVKIFVARLQAKEYQDAYGMWGCTDAHPCPDYPFSKFLDDWGPKSAHADESSSHIGLSQSCGSGAVIRLDYKGSPQEPVALWVERGTKTISFSPWPECPGRHLHLGSWLHSLFN
jgi:hypothetical protein